MLTDSKMKKYQKTGNTPHFDTKPAFNRQNAEFLLIAHIAYIDDYGKIVRKANLIV